MKFSDWIKLKEAVVTQPQPAQTATKPVKTNPKADLDNVRSAVAGSDPKAALAKIKNYYGAKIKKGTDPVQIASDANDMNKIVAKLGGK